MKAFKKAGESTLVNLSLDGEVKPVLIQEVQHHYLTDQPIHVDFYAVRMDEKLHAKIPIHFAGESPAMKAGGVLVKAMQELEVEALPMHIPHSFEVDVGKLTEVGASVYVEQLSVPRDVRVLVNPKTVVATVTAKMTEEQEAALAQAGSVETVKVEAEEKKAEREATKEEAPAVEEKKAGAQ